MSRKKIFSLNVGLDLQKMKTIFAISLYLLSMIEGRKQLETDGLHQRDLELAVKFPPQDRVQKKKQGSYWRAV